MRHRVRGLFCGLALAVGAGAGDARTADGVGSPADLAPYGWISVVGPGPDAETRRAVASLTGAGGPAVVLDERSALWIEWNHPREVRAVEFEIAGPPPAAASLVLEWWRHVWPDHGTGGWMKLDDPFNGQWTVARTRATTAGATVRLELLPLEATEAPGVRETGAPFRRTYKLRLQPSEPLRLTRVRVHSDARLARARLRFEWGLKTKVPGHWAPRFEARNGRVLEVQRLGPERAEVEVEYADAAARLSPDRGHVLFRSGEPRSFAVFVDDVLREGGLFVRDLGVFVSDATQNLSHATWGGPTGEAWPAGTVADMVAGLPEQTLRQVSRAMPAKPPPDLFLGVPDLRQEILLTPQGEVVLRADSLRGPGPDADLRPWQEPALTYRFGSGARPVFSPHEGRAVRRSLEEGWLPVVQHTWETDGVSYTQRTLATVLRGRLAELNSRTGTETVVALSQFELHNGTPEPRTAALWLELDPFPPCRLSVDGTIVLSQASDGQARRGLVPVRGRFETHGQGEVELRVIEPVSAAADAPARARFAREAIRYQVTLAPGATHAIDFAVPYIELLDATDLAALRALSFGSAHAEVVAYWQARLQRGMTIEVPDAPLNDLFKANLWHVLISTDLDPVTGQAQHGAATHQYRNFANETAMVARTLELRGEHDAARRLLETFLANQGIKGLPGNFQSKQGVLYAAHPSDPDPYTAQGYNMHHGWVLWAAAEHYLWTRDRAWLMRHGAKLVQASDWIARERQATMTPNPDGSRRIEHGLAPAGDLEDVEEYLYFYATDAYYHLGQRTLGRVLAAAAALPAGTPHGGVSLTDAQTRQLGEVADRIARDADAFRRDLRASVAESVATTPVVRLRDGTWVPYVPPRAYALTHRQEGWIREGLYPALHLVNGEVYEPQDPFVTWMIQDLEDNIFLSAESGYGLAHPAADFFHLGGFTLQPTLLDLPLVYLQRDQVPGFLRGFYNAACASLYPDGMCFAEWVPALGQGGGPLYKTPDESKFIQWLRQALILERGDTLELGLGVPRAWMADGQRIRVERAATHFGQLDLEILSHASAGHLDATVRLQPTLAPRALNLRLRHPDARPIRSATVNGTAARVDRRRQTIELPTSDTAWSVVARFD